MDGHDTKNNNDEQLHSNLLGNALDFILSAAEFAARGTNRDCKYAILHLADGLELLLKARLDMEHWSLVFDQADNASQQKLRSGDFRSVGFDKACVRLREVCEVKIAESDRKDLDNLHKIRNRITHHSNAVDSTSAKSLLARAMNFCIDFCHQESLVDQGSAAKKLLTEIHQELGKFNDFVEQRLLVIESEFKNCEVWTCPSCWQEAVVVGPDDAKCRFCYVIPDPGILAEQNTEGDLEFCPECGNESTVAFVSPSSGGRWICFACGESCVELEHCTRCGNTMSFSENPGSDWEDVRFCDNCSDVIRRQ